MTYEQFLKEAQWSPKNGVDSWSNYSGPDFSDYLAGPTRSRDSDILAESNFEAALQLLGGQSKHVRIMRASHWGCGWFETILVSKRSKKKCAILFDMYKWLQNYPLLDDTDYFERERAELDETLRYYEGDFTDEVLKYFKIETPTKKQSNAAKRLAKEIFDEDVAWHGADDAFVTPESITRFMSQQHLTKQHEKDITTLEKGGAK